MTVVELAELVKEISNVLAAAGAIALAAGLFAVNAIVQRHTGPIATRLAVLETQGEQHGERIERVEAQVDSLRRAA